MRNIDYAWIVIFITLVLGYHRAVWTILLAAITLAAPDAARAQAAAPALPPHPHPK